MRKSFLLAAWCLAITIHNAEAQSMSHEEEVVRNTYAKITLLSSLGVVTEWIPPNLEGKRDDAATLRDKMAAATPVFTLSDFRVGPVSEILTEKYGQFVTEPDAQVLEGEAPGYYYSLNGYQTDWNFARVRWANGPEWGDAAKKMVVALTVSDILVIGKQNWRSNTETEPVTYTRYATYTVDATLHGQSSGPHKAIFFFGTDAKGIPFVAPNDLITGTQLAWSVLQIPFDPSGLLLSPARELPAFRDWMNSSLMPANSCSSNSTHDYCCSEGRCGISPVDFNRDMATAIPLQEPTP